LENKLILGKNYEKGLRKMKALHVQFLTPLPHTRSSIVLFLSNLKQITSEISVMLAKILCWDLENMR